MALPHTGEWRFIYQVIGILTQNDVPSAMECHGPTGWHTLPVDAYVIGWDKGHPWLINPKDPVDQPDTRFNHFNDQIQPLSLSITSITQLINREMCFPIKLINYPVESDH